MFVGKSAMHSSTLRIANFALFLPWVEEKMPNLRPVLSFFKGILVISYLAYCTIHTFEAQISSFLITYI